MPSFMPAFMDAAALLIASPSKTCRVRVSSTRYRNDPYRARVLPRLSPMSPVVARKQQPRYYVPSAIIVPTVTAAGATATNFAAIVAKSPEVPLRRTATQTPAAAAVPRATTFAAAAAAAAVPEPVTLVPTKPTLGSSSTVAAKPQEHFALVGFKHETSMYVAPFRVSVGDVVIVEADRGEHIGVVQSITTQKPAYNVPNRVVRRASATEVATIDELTFKEAKTTAAVQKQSESLGLGIRVVDVEFQMDLNKLTVFFASKCFVDFRKLQRALFREYRCRIWLVNWDEVRTYSPVPVNPAQA